VPSGDAFEKNAAMRTRMPSFEYGPVCGHEYTTRIASAMKRARSGAGEIGMASASAATPPRTGTSSEALDSAARAAAGRDRTRQTTNSAGTTGFTGLADHF
jgi:hypothetical protein